MQNLHKVRCLQPSTLADLKPNCLPCQFHAAPNHKRCTSVISRASALSAEGAAQHVGSSNATDRGREQRNSERTATAAGTPRRDQSRPSEGLTPRQRRLAQQQRKWQEAQQLQRTSTTSSPAKPPSPGAAPQAPTTASSTGTDKRSSAERKTPSASSAPAPAAAPTAAARQLSAGASPVKLSSFLVARSRRPSPHPPAGDPGSPQPPSKPTPAAAKQPASQHPQHPQHQLPQQQQQQPPAERLPRQQHPQQQLPEEPASQQHPQQLSTSQHQHPPERHPPRQQQQPHRQPQHSEEPDPPAPPSLFAAAPGGDLRPLPAARLLALARHWVRELAEWRQAAPLTGTSLPPSSAYSPPSSCSSHPSSASSPPSPSLSTPLLSPGGSSSDSSAPDLPPAAAERLDMLTAAVEGLVLGTTTHGSLSQRVVEDGEAANSLTHGSVGQQAALGQQELADLVWCVAHYDRPAAVQALYPALGLPFQVLPGVLPQLRLQDFMAEVELRRDVIYLEDGSKAVEESRLTGWQSEIGATFKYSGKEMRPQQVPGGLSPAVREVRDALQQLTGVLYDSCLINYYEDGKCGMRYHVDPLYDRWTPEQAVVSLGSQRTFIFRAIDDFSCRWQYRVAGGDLVRMYGDCQARLQHCVRVERRAGDAGPRMSLVFKQRRRDEQGRYLLP